MTMPLDLYVDEPQSPKQPSNSAQPKRAGGWLGILCGAAMGALILFLVLPWLRSDVSPDDGDDVRPPAVSGLHVLIIEETADRPTLPASQVAIFTSIPLREWYDANCAKEGGKPAYRCFDVDDKLTNESQTWRELREKITIEPPAYLVVNGKRGEQGRLPRDPESFQAVLEKFKGN